MQKQGDKLRLLLPQFSERGVPISAAGWIKTADDGRPYLYLATPLEETARATSGYASIQSVLRRNRVQWLRLTDIKLVGSSTPLAAGMAGLCSGDTDGDALPVFVVSGQLGGVPLDGTAVVYPIGQSAPAPAA